MTAARIATMAKRRIPLRAKIVKPPAKAPASNALAYLSIDLLFVDMGIKKRRSQVRNPDAPHIYSLAVLFHPVNTVRGGTLGVNVTLVVWFWNANTAQPGISPVAPYYV